MPDFTRRSNALEIMDDLCCEGPVVNQTLRELEVINKWLGGNSITINALEQLLRKLPSSDEITIIDLGCGSGEMLRIIDAWGRRRKMRLKLIGIDANPHIIDFAKSNLKDLPHIQLYAQNIFSETFLHQRYDIVIGTLFYHHFSNQQLTHFFGQLKSQVRIGFIINDIHRHWLAYYSIKFLTTFFSKSSMVRYDAPLSVLRAFKKKELEKILLEVPVQHYSIQWKWAFRWKVIWRKKGVQTAR